MKTPSVTPGVIAAGVGVLAQFTGISQDAADNITTLAVSAAAADTVVRVSRAKWVAHLMADKNQDGRPDLFQNISLGWALAIAALGCWAATAAALLCVIFL